MKILVCIKQVPDTTDIKWTEHNTIQREGVESIINPFDVYAIEEALKLKKTHDNVEITVLTMGPAQAEAILRDAIAVGCDNAVLISDRKFAGADTIATAKTISSAIKTKLSGFDLIICGQFAVDGDTAQTGPSIANDLNLPQVTYVKNIERYEEDYIIVKRILDEGTEIVKAKLPALVCVLKGNEEPTRPLINGVIKSQNANIPVYSMVDIGLVENEVGLKGSPTFVRKTFRMILSREHQMVSSVREVIEKIEEFTK